MYVKDRGILSLPVATTPVAVIDFETTGLDAKRDRVVEVSVVRVDPGQPPRLAFDSLVNPERPMGATDIHGLTDEDVADAPRFEDIAGRFVEALSDCVVASYNVYFDIKFLKEELRRTGLKQVPPHLCLMYLRPLLGVGQRCSLQYACEYWGIPYSSRHVASADALAASVLWEKYRGVLEGRGMATFGHLSFAGKYKFLDSFEQEPIALKSLPPLRTEMPKSRSVPTAKAVASTRVIPSADQQRANARHEYWEQLKVILADLDVSDEELVQLAATRRALSLGAAEYRALHARAFASVLSQCVDDREIDDRECTMLRRLHKCLSKLGWAPGD